MAEAPSKRKAPGQLGRYEVVREIGRGAMGVVYLARDPLIGRHVALKTFRLSYAADDDEMGRLQSRFIREAQSAGILSQHPGIVTIHDVTQGGDGTPPFIAMEYVEGTDLKELMRLQGSLDAGVVGEIVQGIADALDYAHAKGVVHRDIKPANVILAADRKIRITDFGIARLDASNLTLDGQLLGTPNYMAPEQVVGAEVDHRADIFSLGVIAYELLTGAKPFQGENLTAVTHRIVHEPHPPPSSLLPGLPVEVDAAIGRALEKSAARRWTRAGDFASALGAAIPRGGSDTLPAFELPPSGPAPRSPAPRSPAPRSPAPPSPAPPSPTSNVPAAPPSAPAPAVAGPAAAGGSGAAAASGAAGVEPGPVGPAPVGPASAGSLPIGPGPASRAPAMPLRTPAPEVGPVEEAEPAGLSPWRRIVDRLAADARAAGPRRLAIVAAAALGVSLLAGGVLATLPGRIAPQEEASTDPVPAARLIRLLQLGGSQLAAGDPAAAAATFRRAERLSSNRARIRALRQRAEVAAAALGQDLEDELESGLPDDFGSPLAPEAELGPDEALGGGSPGSSRVAAGTPPALQGVDGRRPSPSSQRPDLRRSELLDRSRSPGAGSGAGSLGTAAGGTGAGAAVAEEGEAALRVELVTARPSGSVVVAVNERRVISRNFAFSEKTSRFSRRKPTGGELSLGPAEVPAGVVELDVWVAVEGQPAQLTEMTARFPRDRTRRLRVDIDASGAVRVRLE